MSRIARYRAAGIALLLAGVLMPRGWYDALPVLRAGVPTPPIRGVTLLQISLVIEGLLLLALSVRGWAYSRIPATALPSLGRRDEDAGDVPARTAAWALAAITALALGLRLWNLGTDLWLDEITPLLDYGPLSPLQVVATYYSSNNHLLNSLLEKLCVSIFGNHEWAVRLPAAVFGVATIPAIYAAARLALSRRASLGAALLLAVSYHHIFFSQNARGYSSYLLFSILGTALLVRALRDDRFADWAGFVAAAVLNFASLLNSGFVVASQALVAAAALYTLWRRGAPLRPLLLRTAAIFCITGFLGFQLYATALPRMLVVIGTTYSDASSGFSPLSGDFVRELVNGIGAGFGGGRAVAALPFLIAAAAGFYVLSRRCWALSASLVLPLVLTAAFLGVRGYSFSPRFFLLGVPLAALCAAAAVELVAERLAAVVRRGRSARLGQALAAAAFAVLSLASLASLRGYYSLPKQAYKASLAYVQQQRRADDAVLVIYTAEWGFRYYGRAAGVERDTAYHFVRSLAAFDTVVAAHGPGHTMLVTTLPRTLRLAYPDLYSRIEQGWSEVQTFNGSMSGGDITIWRARDGGDVPARPPAPQASAARSGSAGPGTESVE